MLDKIFYISGITLNIYIFYILYQHFPRNPKINQEKTPITIELNQEIKETKELNQEETIKERLRKINDQDNLGFKNWLNYIPGLVGKK